MSDVLHKKKIIKLFSFEVNKTRNLIPCTTVIILPRVRSVYRSQRSWNRFILVVYQMLKQG